MSDASAAASMVSREAPLGIGSVSRKTNETSVSVSVNLDGTGANTISTGVGFFDHMLELFGRHSLIDLEVEAKGDSHVDFHHTVEDVGIALGQEGEAALDRLLSNGQTPILVARDGQLNLYKHSGFWACMDTQRERDELNQLWTSGQAPWSYPCGINTANQQLAAKH